MPTTEGTPIPVKGNTTETVLRSLIAQPTDPETVIEVITALVARFDAKAARRAAKGSGDEE